MIAGNTGNVVCNELHEFVRQPGEDGDGGGRRGGLQQLFDSVEAKQYKRPDMNENLRLGSTLQEQSGRI